MPAARKPEVNEVRSLILCCNGAGALSRMPSTQAGRLRGSVGRSEISRRERPGLVVSFW